MDFLIESVMLILSSIGDCVAKPQTDQLRLLLSQFFLQITANKIEVIKKIDSIDGTNAFEKGYVTGQIFGEVRNNLVSME
jgi:hypothetical protein